MRTINDQPSMFTPLGSPNMTANDILRRIHFAFNFTDEHYIQIFKLGGMEITRQQLGVWAKKESDPGYEPLEAPALATFLNGWIIEQRGLKGDGPPPAEEALSNNQVLNKIKIALSLQAEEVLGLFEVANRSLSKHELSAFFRKPGNKHHRECSDDVLRDFFNALKIEFRGTSAAVKMGKA